MKNLFTFLVTLLIISISTKTSGQVAFSPMVDSLVNEITEESLMELENPLTGNTSTIIGGEEYTIATRHAYTEGNEKAGQWLFEQLEEYGYEPWYHEFGSNGVNVLAQKTGTEYPDQQYMICGHYDDMPSGSLAPGADDNASGTVGVLEAARILADTDTKYTIIFALWDEEELGLIGSNNYAEDAADNGDDILGVINLDMIAWDSNDDYMVSISTNSLSTDFTNDFVDIFNLYTPEIQHNFVSITASDHSSFWNEGYPALLLIEDMDDFNNYYHTTADDIDILNMPYFETLAQASLAGIATFGLDYFVDMQHEPILSGPSTSGRYTTLVVDDLEDMDEGENAPLLYYRADGGEYTSTGAYDVNEDTLHFLIPGHPLGTTIDYYFALQGDDGDFVATLPSGGKGVNPPGTDAPEGTFSYLIDEIYYDDYCSENVPVAIEDNTTAYDTIFIEDEGVILDVDVMVDIDHSYVGDLVISLKGPEETLTALSIANGSGGDDYDNTVFDDEAEQSIMNASAPFEGSYQPQQPLSVFDEMDMEGPWVLQVADNSGMDEGTLQNWCLMMEYGPVSGVNIDNLAEVKSSFEIYPNPANDVLHVKAAFSKKVEGTIAIYDMFGREVKHIANQDFNKGKHHLITNTNNLSSGHYVVILKTSSGKKAQKLIINH